MSSPAGTPDPSIPLPDGFEVGHWSDPEGQTGCTAVLAPDGARGGVWIAGGGPGTRETDVVRPLSNADQASAVVLTGGSAFGLAAADGAVSWLEEQGRGYPTPAGRVPIVPAAVIYDLASGDPAARPDAESGRAACADARGGVPERGRVGGGTGATVGKLLGRERCEPGGVGYAAVRTGAGETVAAVVVVNAFGDVIAEDGSVLAGARGEDGERIRSGALLAGMSGIEPPPLIPDDPGPVENSTLACICTDAALDKRGCSMVARAASAGMGRAIEPVFTPFDGDVLFCLASGEGEQRPFAALQLGAAAAQAVAAAIRNAVG